MKRIDFRNVANVDEYAPVPAGRYSVEIEEAEEDLTRNGDERITLRLRVLDGEHAGAAIFDRIYFSPRALPRLKHLLDAVGVETGADVDVSADLLRGKRCSVDVVVESYVKTDGSEGKTNSVPFAGTTRRPKEARSLPRTEADRIPVVIDTREQRPYRFDPRFVIVTRRGPPAGDYSVAGHEHEVAVERKSLGDFVSSVIHERERFERELARLSGYETSCVLVEADLRDIVNGRYRSCAHPNSVLGSMIALIVDYRVPILFCSTREIAGRLTAGILRRYHTRVVGAPAVGKEEPGEQ
jgi:hypothetical protein